MSGQIAGVLPVAHTPFHEDGQIDWESLVRQVDWAFSTGAGGITTGMVSEITRLSVAERVSLFQRLVDATAGRGPVIAAVGAETTRQAVEFAVAAERAGCHAAMAVPPFLSRLNSDAQRNYFEHIVEAISLPVIVQDASSYVGQGIPLDVSLALLNRYGPERIRFKPEGSPMGPQLSQLRDATESRAIIYEGSGGIFLIDSWRRGIEGTMPGMEFLPCIMAIWNALQAEDEDRAYELSGPLVSLVAMQMQAGLDGFLAVEKYVMHRRGLFTTAYRRDPVGWSMDRETQAEVDRLLARLEGLLE